MFDTVLMNKRFDGFRNTPFLWEASLEGLEMFEPKGGSTPDYPKIETTVHIRLGKLIEQFVLFELSQNSSAQVLGATLQVFHDKRTIGELDCLIKQCDQNLHLEIVYKFYLYDPSISPELNRWIGPNRNDSLVQKLQKLKEKQLPLLHHPEAVKRLSELKLNSSKFTQQLYFKAQLFVPLNTQQVHFPFVNEQCIAGFYLRPDDLTFFQDHLFYIPSKLDWLIEPELNVLWLSFQSFEEAFRKLHVAHKSPLCWMKSSEGQLQKFFIVWWE